MVDFQPVWLVDVIDHDRPLREASEIREMVGR
jgi:hypothetical protein